MRIGALDTEDREVEKVNGPSGRHWGVGQAQIDLPHRAVPPAASQGARKDFLVFEIFVFATL